MRVVIIGGGIAADYLANQILAQDDHVEVLILSKEQYAPYDRIHLCDLVSGESNIQDITLALNPNVTVKLDHAATGLDPQNKQVICGDKRYDYDYVIIASGS
ncbi:MAG: FAD-dependent oxidoreductase, partial [Thiomicrospira sp.]